MKNNLDLNNISKDKFTFIEGRMNLSDERLDTKAIGYFHDAFIRFKKNKASVFGGIIIVLLILFAVIVPLVSPFNVRYMDMIYSKVLPKNSLFENAGFWDGAKDEMVHESIYQYYESMNKEIPQNGYRGASAVIKRNDGLTINTSDNRRYYDLRVDSYFKTGYLFLDVSESEYFKLQKWQDENKIQLIYPMPNKNLAPVIDQSNANYWYKTKLNGKNSTAVLDANGNYQNIYLTNRTDNYSSNRVEGDDGSFVYAVKSQSGYQIRLLYENYYYYNNGFDAQFLLGTNAEGRDILVSLAVGACFSLLLAFAVSAINMLIGTIYGAIEGYYGGALDMFMERISDILNGVPFIVVASLFQLHLAQKVGPIPSLLFAFVLTGWIGTAANVRQQFYRFKRQEYVLAARTLGAGDMRLIFRHIYPNSLGTIVTASVLVIPGVIFSESTLTYLGIVNLSTSSVTSVGTLLAGGQTYLSTYPHIIFFPALFISLLMISFNLFGNGLRDAFNPSLRGVEE